MTNIDRLQRISQDSGKTTHRLTYQNDIPQDDLWKEQTVYRYMKCE